MGRRKVLTTVYLEPEQDELLKDLSAKTGVPVAAYIRRGIDLVLDLHREVLPGQLSLFGEPRGGLARDRPARASRRRR